MGDFQKQDQGLTKATAIALTLMTGLGSFGALQAESASLTDSTSSSIRTSLSQAPQLSVGQNGTVSAVSSSMTAQPSETTLNIQLTLNESGTLIAQQEFPTCEDPEELFVPVRGECVPVQQIPLELRLRLEQLQEDGGRRPSRDDEFEGGGYDR